MTAVQTLSIVTPSYLPDLELCRDLQASVLNFTAPDVDQFIIVPGADRTHFADLAGARTKIRDVGDFLPRSMVKVPAMNMWVNACRPFPPVRGWVAQQIVKLAAAAAMTTDVVLLLDSDVLLIRSLTAAAFAPNGVLQLFELPDGVDATLPRHRVWHHAARRMLGLPPLTAGLLPDYICWPCAWSPAIVYVREVLGAESPVDTTARMRCVSHSDEIPLDEQSLRSMLDAISPEDLAIMVSAKSGTDLTTRRSVLNAFQAPA
jgi:hypothetical protein